MKSDATHAYGVTLWRLRCADWRPWSYGQLCVDHMSRENSVRSYGLRRSLDTLSWIVLCGLLLGYSTVICNLYRLLIYDKRGSGFWE